MKNQYQRMSKEEKKALKKTYYSCNEGKIMNIRLFRLSLTGTIGVLFALYIITNNYIHHNVDWSTWVASIPLILASIVFLIASFILRYKYLNQFAIKQAKNNVK